MCLRIYIIERLRRIRNHQSDADTNAGCMVLNKSIHDKVGRKGKDHYKGQKLLCKEVMMVDVVGGEVGEGEVYTNQISRVLRVAIEIKEYCWSDI